MSFITDGNDNGSDEDNDDDEVITDGNDNGNDDDDDEVIELSSVPLPLLVAELFFTAYKEIRRWKTFE